MPKKFCAVNSCDFVFISFESVHVIRNLSFSWKVNNEFSNVDFQWFLDMLDRVISFLSLISFGGQVGDIFVFFQYGFSDSDFIGKLRAL